MFKRLLILTIVLNSANVFAECFVIDEKKIECVKGFTPKGEILSPPVDENSAMVNLIEDVDFEDFIDEFGETKRRAVYNKAKRTARLQAQADRKAIEESKEAKKKALFGKLRAAIATAPGASDTAQKQILEDILRYLTDEVE